MPSMADDVSTDLITVRITLDGHKQSHLALRYLRREDPLVSTLTLKRKAGFQLQAPGLWMRISR